MYGQKQPTTNGNITGEVFILELTFIEMHIVMQAMSTYGYKHGYGQWNTMKPNEDHAEAAEQLHDELTKLYCD